MVHFLKSLADETRLRIVFILNKGEFSVMEITHILAMGQSRVSRHLKILSEAGVTASRREGAWIFYSLNSPDNECSQIIQNLIAWIESSRQFGLLEQAIQRVIDQRQFKTREFFARVGEDWDLLRNRYLDEQKYYKTLRNVIGSVDRLADLGCGTGETIVQLSQLSQSFIGVDNSPEMLSAARENLKHQLGNRVDLRLGNLEHLPLGDGETQCVLATMVLHHVAQPPVVFQEFHRVLTANGKLVILDFEKHNDELLRREMADLWLGFTESELRGWMVEAGFKKIYTRIVKGTKSKMNLVLAHGRKFGSFQH